MSEGDRAEVVASPDPNELLERMRDCMRRVRATSGTGDVSQMADTFEALDAALSNGAALPASWRDPASLTPEEWATVSMLLDAGRIPGRTYVRAYGVWIDKLRGKLKEIVARLYPTKDAGAPLPPEPRGDDEPAPSVAE